MYAIIQSMGKWRQYLLGRKFVIMIDQRSLRTFMALSRPMFRILDDIRQVIVHNAELIASQNQLNENNEEYRAYSLKEGLLLYKGRIVVPNEVSLRSLLLRQFYSSIVGGHTRILSSFQRLASNFYWKGVRNNVKKFMGGCQVCQRMKE
ncbi:hypothetical protein HRI_001486600 [Hibiscus trionum]|uniref:Integrase zinc-binding domain-containing protein n=1 Tax=Hibiscus trionum TaxID=183268 RepID=A0A9W7HJV5_HIBTR|nr:hypothetical protein HRI_001486600 [Hibiscus trionum]